MSTQESDSTRSDLTRLARLALGYCSVGVRSHAGPIPWYVSETRFEQQ